MTCDGRRVRFDRGRMRARYCAVAGVPVAAGSLALLGAAWAAPAGATSFGGVAVLAPPGDTAAHPLSSGASTTEFTVALPAGASCAGDTAHHGYHVYSYLVRSGSDLAAVRFVEQPSTGYGIFDTTHTYYGAVDTALTTGQIVEIPNDFEWGSLVTSDGGPVPLSALLYSGSSGVWETGVLCANTNGVPTNDWNAQVTFTASRSGAFTWSASPETYSFSSTSSSSTSASSSSSTSPSTSASSGVVSVPARATASSVPPAPSSSGGGATVSSGTTRGGGDPRVPATVAGAPGNSNLPLIGGLAAAMLLILAGITLTVRRASAARRGSGHAAVGVGTGRGTGGTGRGTGGRGRSTGGTGRGTGGRGRGTDGRETR